METNIWFMEIQKNVMNNKPNSVKWNIERVFLFFNKVLELDNLSIVVIALHWLYS